VGFAVKREAVFSEHIVAVPKQAEVGVPVAKLIRQVGITEPCIAGKNITTAVDRKRRTEALPDQQHGLRRLSSSRRAASRAKRSSSWADSNGIESFSSAHGIFARIVAARALSIKASRAPK
jgi:hypothetical protein